MEVISFIGTSVGIITNILQAYNTIQKVISLPEAFDEVQSQLSLAEDLLNAAKVVLEDTEDDQSAAQKCIQECQEKLQTLSDIFNVLKEQAKKVGPTTEGGKHEWASSLKRFYREKLLDFEKTAKASKVEKLMAGIMQKLQTLSSLSTFQQAQNWRGNERKIVLSISALEWVAKKHPSIEDKELDDGGHELGSFTQNIHDTGSGYQSQINNSGDGDVNKSEGGQHNVNGRGANINHHYAPGTTGNPPS